MKVVQVKPNGQMYSVAGFSIHQEDLLLASGVCMPRTRTVEPSEVINRFELPDDYHIHQVGDVVVTLGEPIFPFLDATRYTVSHVANGLVKLDGRMVDASRFIGVGHDLFAHPDGVWRTYSHVDVAPEATPPAALVPKMGTQSREIVTDGLKNDSAKPRAGLVLGGFADALLAVSKLGTFGAEKYSPNGWQKVDEERYRDAIVRHLLAYLSSEKIDADSGCEHITSVAWNALALYELEHKK